MGASYYLAGVARSQSVAPTPVAVTWMATLWPFLPVVYGPALYVIWRASLRRRTQALASAALVLVGPLVAEASFLTEEASFRARVAAEPGQPLEQERIWPNTFGETLVYDPEHAEYGIWVED